MDMPKVHHRVRNVLLILLAAAALVLIALGLWWWLGSVRPQAAVTTPPTPTPTTPPITYNTPVISPRLVTAGLTTPVSITSTGTSGDNRLFVIEQAGKIRTINAAGLLEPTPFLDISAKVMNNGEMGMLGLAFHPQYAQNGYFYVNYIDKHQNTVIARYQKAKSSDQADPNSEKVLLTFPQPFVNHKGGALAFGPDGYLYASLGDGGSGGDPGNRAQDKSTYLGKILRFDVSGDPYKVPASNPFVSDKSAKPEIWAYGLRNPWRISFDRQTGDLYIADVGQDKIEEIDVQPKNSKGGENYGWRCYEGTQPYNASGCADASHYVMPVLTYDHSGGRCSITGGYVYRGRKEPALAGKYFYADYCSSQIYYASKQNGVWTPTVALNTQYRISTFGQGTDGELYFADLSTGSIFVVEDSAN